MSNIKKGRPGAVRKKSRGKQVGSGGQGRQALEGRGPTPKAEDRPYHPAGKAKAAKQRRAAAQHRHSAAAASDSLRGTRGLAARQQPAAELRGSAVRRTSKTPDVEAEFVVGRNAVLEALRVALPAVRLTLAVPMHSDERVRELLTLADRQGVPVVEAPRLELDRMTSAETTHQGVVLQVAAYEYAHPMQLLDEIEGRGQLPLLVALDGVTDPRNLGAIVRSVAAFGGQGVIVPQRRSTGVTSAVWKTSAGAVARVTVAMATNLTQTLQACQARGMFVVGLDGAGEVPLPAFDLADRPLVLVIGSEGKGVSRLVAQTCDVMVSIPIAAATESLNAGVAAGVALYEVARRRGAW